MPTLTSKRKHAASAILVQLLIDLSLGVAASTTSGTSGSSTDWPIFRENMPNSPDNIFGVFGTEGVKVGRLMVGKTIKNPGFQLRIRSLNPDWGWEQASTLMSQLSENVANVQVTLSATVYTLRAITITSGPLNTGKELENSKRYLHTLNGILNVIQE